MPGMMPPISAAPTSLSNGVGASGAAGTPLPSSKGGTAKPKPGTVAAALQEKKESEKARGGSEHGGEKGSENHDDSNSDVGEGSEDDFRRGLTSEERVLLREKKKERLMKENETEHQMDEGLNLSVCKPNGGTEHPTKLEALLAKPIEDLPNVGQHPLDVASLSTNGDPPRTEGV